MHQHFEEFLNEILYSIPSSELVKAMEYSLLGGGKRIRPHLLLSVLEDFNVNSHLGLEAASGLEMIHTYSLIHDDLPALDNDDYRRHKLTNHKVFGEANAILAGDALLTQAFIMISRMKSDPETKVLCLETLSYHAGIEGMIGGQELDLNDNFEHSDDLKRCYELKTGGLFAAALEMGVIISGRIDLRSVARELGYLVGYAFQCQDDVLEATKTAEEIGKSQFSDLNREKMTIVTVLGVEEAKQHISVLFERIDQLVNELTPNHKNIKSRIFEILNRNY